MRPCLAPEKTVSECRDDSDGGKEMVLWLASCATCVGASMTSGSTALGAIICVGSDGGAITGGCTASRSASANAWIRSKRSSGALASAFKTTRSTASGSVGR